MPFKMNPLNPAPLAVLFNLAIIQTGLCRQPLCYNPLFGKNHLCHLSPQVVAVLQIDFSLDAETVVMQ